MSPHQFLMAVSAVLLVSKAAHAEPPKAAVFDFQLANLGAQSPTDEDQARLGPLTDLLRQQLQESGRYQIVSTDPVRAEVEKSSGLRKCGGATLLDVADEAKSASTAPVASGRAEPAG